MIGDNKLTCAICGRTFEPDQDHVWAEVEKRRFKDRNEHEEYAMHMRCYLNTIGGGWSDPA